MEDPTPIAGPSRPPRRVGHYDHGDDVASRIFALQRKNASMPTGSGEPSSRSRRHATEVPDREFQRHNLPQIGVLPAVGPARSAAQPPPSPSRPRGSRKPGSPRPSSSSLRPAELNEFNRGAVPSPAGRALYDPSRPAAPQSTRPDRSARIPGEGEDKRRRPTGDVRRHEPGSVPPTLGKKLFDPSLHDPHHFDPRSSQPPSHGTHAPEGSESSSRMLLRRPPTIRTPEEEADRERERRRRREGSERGSVPSVSTRRKDDQRSKGSRSSDGSESLKDRERGKGNRDVGVKPILKKIHDEIKDLEQELIEIHRKMTHDPEAGISILFDRRSDGDPYARSRKETRRERESAAWMDLIAKHKHLAELHDHFLVTLYDPLVPSSYHQLSVKYNIPSRLWQTAYHLLLERLRHAWMSSNPFALDLLTDVVYDAYRFYSELLENQALCNFRTAWIEALGDLARYRMAIASHVQEGPVSTGRQRQPLSTGRGRIDEVVADDADDHDEDEVVAPEPSGASIGAEVAQSWDVEDKETWRTTARDWYTMGITEKPGEGRLHHHLALLCRDVKGQEGRALHHYVKSLSVTHEFPTSRESILPLFDSALQSQRSLPEATAMDLFLRLHGMLFTKISLDDFSAVMSRYMERLEEDASLDGISRKVGICQTDWMIMGAVNLASVLQYGSAAGLVRKALAQEGAERRRVQALVEEEGEGDEAGEGNGVGPDYLTANAQPGVQRGSSPSPIHGESAATHAYQVASAFEDPPPITFTYALRLAFEVFDFALAHPNRIQGFYQVLNPYIPIFLTFIATIFRQPHVGASILAHVPWTRLIEFINTSQLEVVEEKKLASGSPLPEDWLLRGMEWVGRRVYERGFWKAKSNSRGSNGGVVQPRTGGGDRFGSEMDVLLANFEPTVDISEGVVDDDASDVDAPGEINKRRWKRVAWAAGVLVKHVDGLELDNGKIVIGGMLKAKIDDVEAEKEREREEDRRAAKRKADRHREEQVEFGLAEVELDRENDWSGEEDPELVALRDRRRELQGLLSGPGTSTAPKSRLKNKRSATRVVQGYTMLVFDTNVLLDSLDLFSKVVESGQWSVVVPLPVVTELDGLSKEPAPLGVKAKCAVTYLEARIRTHALCLKIQTTKGNYLSDLLIRTEHLDANGARPGDLAQTMDDRIIHIASFAQDNFSDRSGLLGMPRLDLESMHEASKVLVVSNDRNLRLMARSRGVQGVDEKELGGILGGI
ncbi:hypothetical protein IAU60_004136 [Kwoniella sp. DSM 27419]